MTTGIICLLQAILLLCVFPALPQAKSTVVEELTKSIANASTEQEKSRLYMYRARNFKNEGLFDKAEQDYDAALQYDHKGWIHLERAEFYLKRGNHEQAIKEAVAAEKETPTLKSQSQRILSVAKVAAKEERQTEKPAVILLTRKWNVTYTKSPAQTSRSNIRNFSTKKRISKASKPKSKSRKRGRS